MKNSIHVSPHKNGWQVKKAGSSKASKVCSTQKECIEHGTKQAKRSGAELYIHNKEGKIREKNSFGNDPFPPRG
jgi:hypothetical protein